MADPRRILVVKLADLGDVLVCEPAFRSLRLAFPGARIDVLTNAGSAELVTLLGHDLQPIPFPKAAFDSPRGFASPKSALDLGRLALRLRRARYDRVVLLHHLTTAFGATKQRWLARATGCREVVGLDNGRGSFLSAAINDGGFGARHEAAYMAAAATLAGGVNVDPVPEFPVDRSIASLAPAGAYVAIFPRTGGFSPAREWGPERFAEVALDLAARGVTPVIVGGPDTVEIATLIPNAVNLAGQTTISQLATVLAGAKVAVGGDTFIGHLAAAVGTPVVSIFGPSNADAWAPVARESHTTVVVRQQLACQPCMYVGYRLGQPEGCLDRTCLKRVTSHQVTAAIDRLLGDMA